jgi:multidrug efflux system membrane fusion protein
MEPIAGEYVVNENDKDNETSGSAEAPQSFFRRYRVVMIVVILFAAVVFLVLRHHKHQEELAKEEGAAGMAGGRGGGPGGGGGQGGGGRGGGGGGPVAVTVASVASGDIEVRIPALGTITPLATVTVRPQISGILTRVKFQEGQLVKAGDPLAEIDPRPFKAALDQALGNLRRDQAQLADAKLDLQRFEELIKEDSVAQQQLDTQRALAAQYGGTVESDQAAVETARINLQYTNIVSPVTGRVGLRQVDQGNYVTPGDTNGIVVVTELQPISAIFAVPEDNVSTLMQRLQEGATLSAEAYDRANSAKIAVGEVKTVDNQIDTTTGTIKLRALFDNKDGRLFPNQFVNIQLVVNVLHDQTVMPGSAVRRGAPNGVVSTFVYVVNNANNTVAVRPVTVGVVDGEQVSITRGVSPGDVVVTEGADRLRDGATVLLPANTPQHPTTVAPGAPGRQHGGRGQHRRSQQGQQSQGQQQQGQTPEGQPPPGQQKQGQRPQGQKPPGS